jgi:hypothetical protein
MPGPLAPMRVEPSLANLPGGRLLGAQGMSPNALATYTAIWSRVTTISGW